MYKNRSFLIAFLLACAPLILISCASPAKGISPDAWAYKGYSGSRKDYKELSNVIVRNYSSKAYILPEELDDSKKFLEKASVTIATVDGDDGSRYSAWNGMWGGNTSSYGYYKMWIEPGLKDVVANILFEKYSLRYGSPKGGMMVKRGDTIEFEYEFKAGNEYRLICGLSADSQNKHIHASTYDPEDTSINCYMYYKLHDDAIEVAENRDLVFSKKWRWVLR